MSEKPFIENLRNNQQQADMDGVMVTVSRQAVDETLQYVEALQAELDQYKNGHKGGCYACEPVGELNVRLEKENATLKAERTLHINRIVELENAITEFRRCVPEFDETTEEQMLFDVLGGGE